MRCPGCGHEVPASAHFCPECGRRLTHEDTGKGANEPRVSYADEQEMPQTSGKRRLALIACGAVLALALICAGVFRLVSTVRGRTTAIPVTFTAGIVGYGEASSRIPVRITGTTEGGTEVDLTCYLARSGADVELARGSYELEVLGSPITEAGLIYEYPTDPLAFTVGAPDADGTGVTVSEPLVFTPLDAADLTDEEIEDAVHWARKDEDASVDADALEAAALDRRERARAGEDVDRDLVEPALPGAVSA